MNGSRSPRSERGLGPPIYQARRRFDVGVALFWSGNSTPFLRPSRPPFVGLCRSPVDRHISRSSPCNPSRNEAFHREWTHSMLDPIHIPVCPPVTCRITRFFDAPPEQIVQAWRDPDLFSRPRGDHSDAFVQLHVSPGAEPRFAITLGHSNGPIQERLPLRVTCEPQDDEAGEFEGCEPDCEDTVFLTLAVATARPNSQQRQLATPCTLSFSSPQPEWTDDLAVALTSIADALAAHLRGQRRGH